ncbi:copper chaperone PCu(A)C [Mangrovitalea sediminis]|uniref:copper chaperone PCu(A)C n=1 Tax=Mangrovitalea sediminis TaxID=1982043 RepID=UPI000BE4EE13|nr:copper chaperone PCu(A)C [Mangrovitalea sediminis]
MAKARVFHLNKGLVSLGLFLAMCWMSTQVYADIAPVKIDNARLRLLAGGLPLAGYFTLTNTGDRDVRLVGAYGPAFRRIMLHQSKSVNGMEKMVMVKAITVKPGEKVVFAPGGYHLMMWRLEPLKVDQTTPVTLKFADGKTKTAAFRIGGPATE